MTKYKIRATESSYGHLLSMTTPVSYVDERDLARLRGAIESARKEEVLIDGHRVDRRVFVIDSTSFLLLWQLVTDGRAGAPRTWVRYAGQVLRDANTGRGGNIIDLVASLEANERTVDL